MGFTVLSPCEYVGQDLTAQENRGENLCMALHMGA